MSICGYEQSAPREISVRDFVRRQVDWGPVFCAHCMQPNVYTFFSSERRWIYWQYGNECDLLILSKWPLKCKKKQTLAKCCLHAQNNRKHQALAKMILLTKLSTFPRQTSKASAWKRFKEFYDCEIGVYQNRASKKEKKHPVKTWQVPS